LLKWLKEKDDIEVAGLE